MAGRARAQKIDKRDKSWMKFVNCDICGWEICVNNYPDRKSRIPKFMGVVLCGACRNRRTPLEKNRNTTYDFIKLYRFIQVFEARGCLRPKPRKKKGGFKPCGECVPCKAGEVLKGCRANLPPLP